MKKFFIFVSLIALISCNDKSPLNQSSISGSVQNMPAEFLILQSQSGGDPDTVVLNEDGTFNFTRQLEKAGNYYFQVNRKVVNLYLEPGKNLEFSFDASNIDSTITFAGDLGPENRYNSIIDNYNRTEGRVSRESYMIDPLAFRDATIEKREAREILLNDYIASNPGLSDNFINIQTINNDFNHYNYLLNYEQAHNYYANEEVILPDDWYSFEDNIDINNPVYLENNIWLSVISTIINKNVNETAGLDDDAWGTSELLGAQFDWVMANITNPDVSEHFLNSFVSQIIDYMGPFGIEKYVDKYLELSTNEENRSKLQETVAEWAPLAPGNDAPAFTLPDINGNEVSLSDFEGSYVYIDFWATWCGPCKIEIPVLETLTEEYKDKNLVIVSISVDKDKQAWIDMVTRDKPEWLQLHDGVNMNDEYLVKFIPTFVLLDREGKIINPRAPKPSSGEKLTSLFDSLEGI